MKAILPVAVGLILLLTNCRKNTTPSMPGKKWLHKVIRNDVQLKEYTFSTNKKLVQYQEFITAGGATLPSTLFLYTYTPAGLLAGWKNLSDDDTLYSHTKCTYDVNKRISKYEEFTPGNMLYKTTEIEYTAENLIAKKTNRVAATGKVLSTRSYKYDDKGRLTEQLFYLDKNDNGQLLLSAEIKYQHLDDAVLYEHWKPFMVDPTDLCMDELTMASRNIRYYDDNEKLVTEIRETASGREYDKTGVLLSQIITKNYLKPVKADEIYKFEYMYTE